MKSSDYLVGLGLIALMMGGCEGCGDQDDLTACDCEEANIVDRITIASPSSPSGSISNYDEDGSFTADAACHADMYLFFYWEDSTRAATTEIPPIVPSFETPLGYFPSSNLHTKQEVVGLDENGPIYHYKYYYTAYEAQDKNQPGGTSYRIAWTYNSSSSSDGNVKIHAQLNTRVYDPNEYTRTDLRKCAN